MESFVHLKEEKKTFLFSFTKITQNISPNDEFLFTKLFIAANIKLFNDFFCSFLRIPFFFLIQNTRTIVLHKKKTWTIVLIIISLLN